MKQQPTLESNRLILRPFELTDAKEVQRLAGDRAIADTTLEIPHPYEDGIAEKWISTHQAKFEASEMAHFAIILRTTNGLIGAIGVTIVPRFERAEPGYWIGKPYWGNGYCTEAARAVLEYGFTTLKLNRIHAHHFKRNPASGRVLEKLGMLHEGFARQHVKKWDIFEDIELYGILREEWHFRLGDRLDDRWVLLRIIQAKAVEFNLSQKVGKLCLGVKSHRKTPDQIFLGSL